jgi:hypothetical protein
MCIEPGEGYRLPADGLLVDLYSMDKREPDIMLRVRHRHEAKGSF